MKIDIEFKNLIPALTQEEFAGLENSIKAEGCREAIITWNDTIVDGHNRYEICTRHNIPFRTCPKDFADRNDAKIWIIKNQFSRRNLSAFQRTELALELECIFREKAKENLSLGGQAHKGNQYTKMEPCQISDKVPPIDTKKELAKVAGVSHDTIAKVKIIKEKASPEAIEKLRSGNETINETYKQIKKQEKLQAIEKREEEFKKSNRAPSHVDIYTTDRRYNIIYADPPWQYWEGGHKAQSVHYNTMSIDDICALPVSRISDNDCILFLWVTFPILEDAFKVIQAWGFNYSTCGFCWIKKNKAGSNFFGCGGWTRANSELCLIGIKGSVTRLDNTISQVIEQPREEHSKKPDVVRSLITRLVGELPRIELFARAQHDGWDCWGNHA